MASPDEEAIIANYARASTGTLDARSSSPPQRPMSPEKAAHTAALAKTWRQS
ncbi:MAG TPA: hypothetical protein VNC16_04310 [Solirubrobacterales bacterium]|jgi:hypothetical protein|nr:hypothetical protein [Solirubrobacterales bacterium]